MGLELSYLLLKSPLVLWIFTDEHWLHAPMPFAPKSFIKIVGQIDTLDSINLAFPLAPITDLKSLYLRSSHK